MGYVGATISQSFSVIQSQFHKHVGKQRQGAGRHRLAASVLAAGLAGLRVTSSSQKLPLISEGKVRPRGRQTDRTTKCVSGPGRKARWMGCQGVVPTVVSVETSRFSGCNGSETRNPGPLSDVMFSERA